MSTGPGSGQCQVSGRSKHCLLPEVSVCPGMTNRVPWIGPSSSPHTVSSCVGGTHRGTVGQVQLYRQRDLCLTSAVGSAALGKSHSHFYLGFLFSTTG